MEYAIDFIELNELEMLSIDAGGFWADLGKAALLTVAVAAVAWAAPLAGAAYLVGAVSAAGAISAGTSIAGGGILIIAKYGL